MGTAGVGAAKDPTRILARRTIAYLVDASLVLVAVAVVIWIAGDVQRVPDCDHVPAGRSCFGYSQLSLEVGEHALAWFLLTAVVMAVLIVGLPQAIAGTSAGKSLFGLRVVRPDGSKPGWWRSMIRLVAWGIDGIALLLPVALWTAFLTPGHRRVGDYLAGTYVVRKEAAGAPVRAPRPAWWPSRDHVGWRGGADTDAASREPAAGGAAGDAGAGGLRE
jgi:uncharacterized RDD family membrane protein YckC